MGIFTFLLAELGHGASRSSLGVIVLGRWKNGFEDIALHGLGTSTIFNVTETGEFLRAERQAHLSRLN